MNRLIAGILAILLMGISRAAPAQPRTYKVGLIITDGVMVSGLPAHLQARHPQLVADLRAEVRLLLSQLGRFQVLNWDASFSRDRYTYHGVGEIDLALHISLLRADKVFSNQIIYANQSMWGLPPGYGGQEAGLEYEVVSLPAISDRLAIRLVDPQHNKVLWSVQRDSTVIVPYDAQGFILNTRKYPGLTPPGLLREHLAVLMRLRQDNSAVDRLLDVADRWFISKPAADVVVSQALLEGMVKSIAEELDSNLPLEGRIANLLPSESGGFRVQLDIGAQHGLVPTLRLDVWRPLPATQKVGELEVVAVDSTTATARLIKLNKKIRKQGEGLQVQDRVISPKRPPKGRRNRP